MIMNGLVAFHLTSSLLGKRGRESFGYNNVIPSGLKIKIMMWLQKCHPFGIGPQQAHSKLHDIKYFPAP
jgi:hypothetical protein